MNCCATGHKRIFFYWENCPLCKALRERDAALFALKLRKGRIKWHEQLVRKQNKQIAKMQRQLRDPNWVLVSARERKQILLAEGAQKPKPSKAKSHPTLTGRVKRHFNLKHE